MVSREHENSGFLTMEDLDRRAAEYAKATDQEQEEHVVSQWLVFELAEQFYTIAMDDLDEVAVITNGAHLPHAPAGVMGLINLRGNTVLLADMGAMLSGRSIPAPQPEQRILLYKDQEKRTTGFLVDRVRGIDMLSAGSFEEYTPGGDDAGSRFIEAVTDIDGKGVARINIRAMVDNLGVKG